MSRNRCDFAAHLAKMTRLAAEANRGRKYSDEHRRKIGEAVRARRERERMAAARRECAELERAS